LTCKSDEQKQKEEREREFWKRIVSAASRNDRLKRAWIASVITAFFAWWAYEEVVQAPIAARIKQDFVGELQSLAHPLGAVQQECEHVSGPRKVFVACRYSGEIDTRSLDNYYELAFARRGWKACGSGEAEGVDPWRLFCKGEWRARLYRPNQARASRFGLILTWSDSLLGR